jgi:hypothetical protein
VEARRDKSSRVAADIGHEALHRVLKSFYTLYFHLERGEQLWIGGPNVKWT